jgi:hypothetical protein
LIDSWINDVKAIIITKKPDPVELHFQYHREEIDEERVDEK